LHTTPPIGHGRNKEERERERERERKRKRERENDTRVLHQCGQVGGFATGCGAHVEDMFIGLTKQQNARSTRVRAAMHKKQWGTMED
jgi:hypothetical protein